MRRSRGGTALTAAMLMLVVPAAASGKVRFLRVHAFARSYGPMLSDGRWAVYQPSLSTTRVIDSRGGHAMTLRDPVGCTADIGIYHGLIAVGGGELLYRCQAPTCPPGFDACAGAPPLYYAARFVVVDAGDGAVHEITRLPWNPIGAPTLTAVGSQWVEGVAAEYKNAFYFYLNWRTGQVNSSTLRLTTGEYIDLDSQSLLQQHCPPIRPLPADPVGGEPQSPRQADNFESPFELGEQAVEVPSKGRPAGKTAYRIDVRHCGTDRAAPVALDPDPTSSVQMAAGIASWIDEGPSNSAHFYVMRLHKQFPWHGPAYRLFGVHFPDPAPVGAPTRFDWHLVHAAGTAYQSVRLHQALAAPASSVPPFEIYAARIPD